MKTVLLIIALLICAQPTGAFAGDPPSPGDRPGKQAAAPRPAAAQEAGIKAFIHPDTGEILTYEQWQALGLDNEPAEADSLSSSGTSRQENPPTALEGRRVNLGNGDYVIVVDVPESETAETTAWFDEEGKAHIRCNH